MNSLLANERQDSVGADLSCLPLSAPGSGAADVSALAGYFDILMNVLIPIIGPLSSITSKDGELDGRINLLMFIIDVV